MNFILIAIFYLTGEPILLHLLRYRAFVYGIVTGTVSSGLMLLRILDPELKTPVAREIGFMSLWKNKGP